MAKQPFKPQKPGYKSKVRNSKTMETKPVLYITTEGNYNKSEKAYFPKFNSKYYTVKMITNSASDPVGMVRKFKSKLKNDDGIKFRENIDAAICMFDTDCNSSKDKQISLALNECKTKPFNCIQLILSNPCFEIWYLLHKRYSTRKYDESEQVISELKNYQGWENYSKSDNDTYEKTIIDVDKAIKNAKRLEKEHTSCGLVPQTVGFMPSTEVYKIVELLLLGPNNKKQLQ